MSSSFYFSGSIPLKPGTTMPQIMELLETDDEAAIDLTLADDLLDYNCYDLGWTDNEAFEQFLDAVGSTYAAKGWVSYERNDNETDQDDEVFRGPNPVETEIEYVEGQIEHLRARIEALRNYPRPASLTQSRAYEILLATPLGGDMEKHMSVDEIDYCRKRFMDPNSHEDCFAAVIGEIARNG